MLLLIAPSPVACARVCVVHPIKRGSQRLGRADSLDFNNYAAFKRSWTGQDAQVPETKAEYAPALPLCHLPHACATHVRDL